MVRPTRKTQGGIPARRCPAVLMLLLFCLAALALPGEAGAADAVTARNVVAAPPNSTMPMSGVYAGDEKLPMDGITVHENASVDEQFADELDDYGEEETQSIADPLEKWNRFWFGFNDIMYLYIAKPAYEAWEFVVPSPFRTGLSNFWHNLLFPMRFVNNLLQLRFLEAGVEFGRFVINTTAGFGGFFDVAKREKTIVPVHPEGEDFGQTLGRWGIPHGIYLVWPFYGPSSIRETFGRAGDYFCYPAFAASYFVHQPWYVTSGTQMGFFFNDLGSVLPTYTALKDASVDPYIMMREAYIRHRAIQVAR
ncbi:MAG: VacJ family lipoprotein [Desulfovibrionaceae bacterium]|nr:VacJ family lipoprotein [Desulfovibrionaceae bacterium]